MSKDKVGYIYILTNECFHKSSWIKIGYTVDLDQRLRALNNTSVPTPFEVYATYEVPADAGIADKHLHKLILKLNPELKISPNKEFFEIEPWDAYDILEAMAKIHGRMDKLVQYKNNANFNDPDKTSQIEEYTEEGLYPKDTFVGGLYDELKNKVLALYPDLTINPLKHYVGFKKGKKHNVISVWPKEKSLEVVLNAKLGTLNDPNELAYDISNRRWTSAQYAFRYDDDIDKDVALDLIKQTYTLVK